MTPHLPGTPDLPAGLAEQLLAEAFPFHLVVDGEGRVVRTGPSLLRVCPDLLPGVPVEEHLRVTSPVRSDWQSPSTGRLVLLAATCGRLLLRGQLLALGDGVLFVGSPWVTDGAQLSDLGLRLTDFAPADPVTDFLMLLQAQSSALSDAQHLATRLEQVAARQSHQAGHDGLTGLPNRTLFGQLLEREVTSRALSGGSVGVVLLDLDRFKEINDTLGHHCGDQLLQQIGPRIRGVLRADEVMARLGGDEFALLVSSAARGPGATSVHEAVTRRVLAALHEPFLVGGVTLLVEASAGVAVSPEHGTTGELLLQRADIAMYQAKHDKESVAVYDAGRDVHEPRKLTLLAQLRSALDGGELVLHYQPLLDLASREVRGVEALVRWQHPDEGLLPPSDFLPLAEGSGLIHELTRQVLDAACAQAVRWRSAGTPLVVSVNVSARCLLDIRLPQMVAATLARHRLPADLLKLEITESAIISDPVRAQRIIGRLHELGIALSIDDFGTGYTCLAHLRDLPVQELKIDRSFVTRMLSEPKDAVIVRTGVELARRLGLSSVAEGVEDDETLLALAELGVTTAQGYGIGRPVPAPGLAALLSPAPLSRHPVRRSA